MHHFNSNSRGNYKLKDDYSPLTSADLEVNDIIINGMQSIFPNDIIISEENYNSSFSSNYEKFWLIDPIDGTKEFINGNENFSVNFSLINFNSPIFGLVAQPSTKTVWYNFNNKSWKIKDGFDIKNSEQIKCKNIIQDNFKVIASKNHTNIKLDDWIKLIKPSDVINIGSSIKFCLIAEGFADIYPRNTPTMEWDTAAGHSILKSAGGNILTENGLELAYGKTEFKNKNFVAIGKTKKRIPSIFVIGDILTKRHEYEKEINDATEDLKNNKLVCFPTETVYGLGGIGNSYLAIDAIYNAKNRPKKNPIIAHVKNIQEARKLGQFTKIAEIIGKNFWPGPLTIVLQINYNNKLAKVVSQGRSTIALRVPSHPVALDLLEKLDTPILAPSANKSGHVSPTSAKHVISDFGSKLKNKSWEISKVLDFGSCEIGIESTVIDCRGKLPIILREGYITSDMIKHFTNLKTFNYSNSQTLLSPGMMTRHYSPKTKVLINQQEYISGSGVLNFGKGTKNFQNIKKEFNLSPSENLLQAASLLYEGLRYLDSYNLKYIQVPPIPMRGLGKAINDRLIRASNDK